MHSTHLSVFELELPNCGVIRSVDACSIPRHLYHSLPHYTTGYSVLPPTGIHTTVNHTWEVGSAIPDTYSS